MHSTMSIRLIVAVMMMVSLLSCTDHQEADQRVEVDLTGVISSYTTGSVASETEIMVQFANAVPDEIWQKDKSLPIREQLIAILETVFEQNIESEWTRSRWGCSRIF